MFRRLAIYLRPKLCNVLSSSGGRIVRAGEQRGRRSRCRSCHCIADPDFIVSPMALWLRTSMRWLHVVCPRT